MTELQSPQNKGNGDAFDIPLEIQASSARRLEEQRQQQADERALILAARKKRGETIKTGTAVVATAATLGTLAYLGVQAMDSQAQQNEKDNKQWSDDAEQNQRQQDAENGMYDDNKIDIQLPTVPPIEDDK